MKELFTVMLFWEDEPLGAVVDRMEAEKLRLVLVRNGEPVAILVPFADRDALEIGLWEKGTKEHLAKIFGDVTVGEPAGFKTSELEAVKDELPTPDNFDLFETDTLMNYEECPSCGEWYPKDKRASHRCAG